MPNTKRWLFKRMVRQSSVEIVVEWTSMSTHRRRRPLLPKGFVVRALRGSAPPKKRDDILLRCGLRIGVQLMYASGVQVAENHGRCPRNSDDCRARRTCTRSASAAEQLPPQGFHG
jgi:hypothetical protein